MLDGLMEVDARTLGAPGLDADVCIVGAGPAGLALARELAARARRIVLLESGGRNPDPAVQALSEGPTSGDAYAGPGVTRHRQAGGTTRIWNTRFDAELGAKYVPLDAVDFEAREWWPLSGWPFDRAQLDPYYARAQAVCGLGRAAYRGEDWQTPERPCLGLSPGPLTTGVYQFGPGRLFTEVHLDEIRRAPNALLCLNATVVDLARDAGRRSVTYVEAACVTGRRLRVRAPLFVLAAGGIENARLLLLQGGQDESGMVGRCFMEHPRDASCRLLPADPGLLDRFGLYDLHRGDGGVVMGRLTITDEARRRQELPAMSMTLQRRGRGWWRGPGRRGRAAFVELLINLEQAPDPDNRVTLGEDRDRFNLPRAAIHWRWRAFDQRNLGRIHALVTFELARHGLGRVEIATVAPPDPNAHHHMGTTRMHRDPRHGVVDEHARVHGMANLFVAGSSVFPTCGFANPTLTIVALALRLADHLETRLHQLPA
ncbi:MAG TPA: GMC family oxidoreductase [Methylomirabilota bacterium]|nr:GMC family oxidoreductase [Methylomirabilota bacterium]